MGSPNTEEFMAVETNRGWETMGEWDPPGRTEVSSPTASNPDCEGDPTGIARNQSVKSPHL